MLGLRRQFQLKGDILTSAVRSLRRPARTVAVINLGVQQPQRRAGPAGKEACWWRPLRSAL